MIAKQKATSASLCSPFSFFHWESSLWFWLTLILNMLRDWSFICLWFSVDEVCGPGGGRTYFLLSHAAYQNYLHLLLITNQTPTTLILYLSFVPNDFFLL